MINRILIIILLFAVNQFSSGTARAAVLLKTINRSDESTHLQLSLQFDRLPAFTTTTIGRRVDIELQDTDLAENMVSPTVDDRLIKIVSNQQKAKAILSFYFRYPPQKVTPENNKDTAMVTLDILLGNPLSTTAPELPVKPGAAAGSQTPADSINPITASLYAKHWISFFSEYESQVEIAAPPTLFLPPFPLAAAIHPHEAGNAWLPVEIATLANDNKWTQVSQLLRNQVAGQPSEQLQELFLLTYAEALIRAGEYKEPYILLQRIILQYPDSLMASLAQFLLIYQQASRGDHTSAYYELGALFKKIEKDTPFTPHFSILLAELALLAGRPADAETFLNRDDVVRDDQLKNIRRLRKADLFYGKNEKAKALTAYQDLAGQTPLLDSDPMSLAHFCDALYGNKRFQEAAKKYRLLSDLLNNKPLQDLALFRLAMSQLQSPITEKKAGVDLQQIQNSFSGTPGGIRALLKQTDLEYISKRTSAVKAEAVYRKIADKGDTVMLREEASFKQALVNALAGEHQASVAQCMEILREFQSGKLRTEVKALLIEQLPGVIKQLVHEKEYIKALVLAKQNKAFFSRGWLNTSLLNDLAGVYSKLGLTDQTAQTYQYLFEISSDADKEKIYLPLLQGLLAAGQDSQVEEYADRYLLRYPKGNDAPAIFLIKIRTLYENGHLDKAIKLLQSETRHTTPQLEFLKARIFFESKQWQNVINTLNKPELKNLMTKNNALFLLAESYFQTGQDALAAQEFRQVVEQGEGTEQVQFRLAQVASKNSSTVYALNLFKELAEKGKDPLWTKLAREEVAILQLQQKK